MLAWSRLSRNQRAFGAFLLFIFFVSSPFLIKSAGSISSQAQIGGALLCLLGLILNPVSFTEPIRATIDLQLAPKICRRLLVGGAVLFFAGIVITPLFL